MRIVCFCGLMYIADSDIAPCPRCHAVAVTPRASTRDAGEMRAALDRLLAEHEPRRAA